jgi:hypothetical protein
MVAATTMIHPSVVAKIALAVPTTAPDLVGALLAEGGLGVPEGTLGVKF